MIITFIAFIISCVKKFFIIFYNLLFNNQMQFNSSYRYLQLLGLIPTDPHILQRLGQLFDSEGDKQQAYQYYYDVRNYILDLSFI